ncbi:hypothetical protein [Archangium sp.]|jgi:hypothetical protein|uniref:hypothetical protein n=1 Tax=Archangium sp. TaxID=1872627 RepID=UPI002EDB5BE9
MSIRMISWSVLVVGASLFGMACGPTEEPPLASIEQHTDEAEKKPPCGHEPGYTYVSRDPAECPAILFICPEGSTAFFNDCGCGCRTTP